MFKELVRKCLKRFIACSGSKPDQTWGNSSQNRAELPPSWGGAFGAPAKQKRARPFHKAESQEDKPPQNPFLRSTPTKPLLRAEIQEVNLHKSGPVHPHKARFQPPPPPKNVRLTDHTPTFALPGAARGRSSLGRWGPGGRSLAHRGKVILWRLLCS